MKTLTLLLSLVSLASCGKSMIKGDFIVKKHDHDRRQFKTTDPVFNEQINEFLDKYYEQTGKDINVSNIPINFGDTNFEGSQAIGICYSWNDGRREIIINKYWWDHLASDVDQHNLIKHELGHCALNRRHKQGKNNGIKLSIMNPYHLSGYYYTEYEEEYDIELFTGNHSNLVNSINNSH